MSGWYWVAVIVASSVLAVGCFPPIQREAIVRPTKAPLNQLIGC